MERMTGLDVLKSKPLLGANTPHSCRYLVLTEAEADLIREDLQKAANRRRVPKTAERAA
jgi:hypothetical protein